MPYNTVQQRGFVMITYTYRCKSCGKEFEKVQRITDDLIKKCPFCGKEGLEIVITGGSGFMLRGSDWNYGYKKKYNETCCSRGESCDQPKRCCERH